MFFVLDDGVEREATEEEIAEIEARQLDASPSVPHTITNGQGREALLDAGLYAAIQPTIDAIEDDDTRERAQIAWQYRPTFERSSPFVMLMADKLALSEEQLDQLFIDAAKL